MEFRPSDPPCEPNEALFHLQKVAEKGIDSEERNKRYDKFSYLYDTTMKQCNYNAPKVTAEILAEYIPEGMRDKVKILDIGAGTGFVGEELRKHGFMIIDGLDPSKGMLSRLKEKGIYRTCICDTLSSKPLDIPEGLFIEEVENHCAELFVDTYDVITVTGSHGRNHLEYSAIREMARLVKPGGLVIIITRQEFMEHLEEYKNRLIPFCDELEKNGIWKKRDVSSFPDFYTGIDGIKIVYEIC